MRDVSFGISEYLGGLPGTKKASGNPIFSDEAVGIGVLHPKKGAVRWEDMVGVSFDSGSMKKSGPAKRWPSECWPWPQNLARTRPTSRSN